MNYRIDSQTLEKLFYNTKLSMSFISNDCNNKNLFNNPILKSTRNGEVFDLKNNKFTVTVNKPNKYNYFKSNKSSEFNLKQDQEDKYSKLVKLNKLQLHSLLNKDDSYKKLQYYVDSQKYIKNNGKVEVNNNIKFVDRNNVNIFFNKTKYEFIKSSIDSSNRVRHNKTLICKRIEKSNNLSKENDREGLLLKESENNTFTSSISVQVKEYPKIVNYKNKILELYPSSLISK